MSTTLANALLELSKGRQELEPGFGYTPLSLKRAEFKGRKTEGAEAFTRAAGDNSLVRSIGGGLGCVGLGHRLPWNSITVAVAQGSRQFESVSSSLFRA
jgi:hypothetical protein